MQSKAREFISSLVKAEQINFGLNIFILDRLLKEELIYFTDSNVNFRDLIHAKKESLTRINPLEFFDNEDSLDIDSYLQKVAPDDTFEVDEDFDNEFKKVIKAQELRQNKFKIGILTAFSFDLNISNGREDYALKLKSTQSSRPEEEMKKVDFSTKLHVPNDAQNPTETLKDNSFSRILHQIDNIPVGSSWPHTQMWKKSKSSNHKEMLPIFAFKGFSQENIKKCQEPNFEATGFFEEIEKNNIQYMVAIGIFGPENIKGYDFPPYFLLSDTYIKKDNEGNDLRTVTITPKTSSLFSADLFEYVVDCKIETYDSLKQNHTIKTHTFTVINIPIKDGTPLNLDERTRLKLFDFLLDKLNEGANIGAHCREGRGRTGELLAILIALYTGRYQQIFDGNPIDEIRDYVLELREQRAGMILEWTQLIQTIEYIAFMMDNVPKRKLERNETPVIAKRTKQEHALIPGYNHLFSPSPGQEQPKEHHNAPPMESKL